MVSVVCRYRLLKCDQLCLEGDLRLKSVYMLSDAGGLSMNANFLRKLYKRFSRTAPIADLYYPLYLRKSVLVNAPSSISLAFTFFGRFLSREITDAIQITAGTDAGRKKAHALLDADVDLAIVPQCYGGQLPALTPEMQFEIGCGSDFLQCK